ncbi:Uncharacterised protein [Oligella ureolytica]|uniref:Uncharacterized protein n=1 Tax=Oligella ureolytica TaxID=90244 RepID=A0A378X986_9BURK|nr:hypothetical protein [Oligella ureolytica]SUA50194.1 Uncharacterised protein [Oligella ureolytica]SUA51579.1 Uncharacterised protein [Oligella ureolytica]
MATRKELITALSKRYKSASRSDKSRILDEFIALTDYHRKHAIRILSESSRDVKSTPKLSPYYDSQVVEQLIIVGSI